MNKNVGIIVGIIAVVVAGFVAFAMMNNDGDDTANNSTNSQQNKDSEMAATEAQDIVTLASGTESLSTLVAAVKAAGLVETLQGDGPFTVLAPTNDAFAKLPAGTVESLLLPENKDALTGILTYHVIPSKVVAADLTNGQKVTTVQGAELTVEITDGKVYFVDAKGGKAMVTTPDVTASNGVVHIIDSVLMYQ
jgi:uncharacterized surface protein with fasciclin (FAS1) repeats